MAPSHISQQLVRSRYQAEIDQQLETLGHQATNALVYYGIPELTWEFAKASFAQYQSKPVITGLINGQGLKDSGATPVECLIQLRKRLGKKGIDFSCFDIALWCYLVGAHPELALDSVELSNALGRQEKLNQIFETLSAGQGLDLSKLKEQMDWAEISPTLVELIPHMLADVIKVAEEVIPAGVFIAKLSWFFVGLNEKRRQWWITRGSEDLKELKEKCIDVLDIAQFLPLFLARDIKRHLERTDLPENQQRCIIFVDQLNALLDDDNRCPWLETLLSKQESSPYVLWVISHHQPVAWLDNATQQPLLPLTEPQGQQILKAFDLSDSVVSSILNFAQGSPQKLNLALSIWQQQNTRPSFRASQFPKYLANQFSGEETVWSSSVLQHLRVFSLVKTWNFALFEQVQNQFLSGEDPLSADEFHALPYVQSLEKNQWTIHPVYRAEFIQQSPPQEQSATHQWLYQYYQQQILADAYRAGELLPALDHAMALKPQTEPIQWMVEHLATEQGKHGPEERLQVLQLIAQQDWLPPLVTVKALWLIGREYEQIQEWEPVIPPLEKALQLLEPVDEAPDFLGQMFYLVSQAYLAVGRIFDANKLALQALEVMNKSKTSEPAESIALQLHRAWIAKSQQSSMKQREAQDLCHQALEMVNELSLEPEQYEQFRLEIVQLQYTQYTLDESLHLCEQIVQKVKALNPQNDLAIQSRTFLANLYYSKGMEYLGKAFQLYEEAIEIGEAYYSPDNPLVQSLLQIQLKLCHKVGNEEAAAAIEERIQVPQLLLSSQSTPDYAESLNRVGENLRRKGKYGQAEPLLMRALVIRKEILDTEHPDVATSLNNLAGLYENQGRYEEAEPLYLEALALRKKLLGLEHPDVATSLNNLAGLYKNQGRYEESEPLYLEALDLRKKLLGPEHPYVASSLNNLALLYDKQGRYEESEPLYLEVLDLCKKLLGLEHPDVATSYWSLGFFYFKQEEYQKAKALYLIALEIYQQKLGESHPSTQALRRDLNDIPDAIEPLSLEDLGL